MVHRTIHRFNPSGPSATFRGWLWPVIRNTVLQRRRKCEAHPSGGNPTNVSMAQLPDPWSEESESEPPGNPGDTTTLLRRTMIQIRSLVDPLTWKAFWDITVHCRPTGNVAVAVDISPAAVCKAKSHTLQRLRKRPGNRQ